LREVGVVFVVGFDLVDGGGGGHDCYKGACRVPKR
jgi:hypothetical protein